MSHIEFSIIISCYYEEKSIDEFYTRLSATLEKLARPYELIFVNDGSKDRTFEHLVRIFDNDSSVRCVLDLFKNSGQASALTAGILESSGKAIVFIDSDLQLDPENLPSLIEQYDLGNDVVSGYRAQRKDPAYRLFLSWFGNMIMRKASGSKLQDFGCTFKIYDARLVQAFAYGPNKTFQTVEVISRAGRVAEVSVNHHPRKYGSSGWTFWRLFDFNLENLLYAPGRPFQVIMMASTLLATALVARVAVAFFIEGSILKTITHGLLLHVLFVSFLVLTLILSLVGELVIRSFQQLKSTPKYIVKERRRRDMIDSLDQSRPITMNSTPGNNTVSNNYSDAELRELLGKVGENVKIHRSVTFFNPKQIFVESNIRIDANSLLSAGDSGIFIEEHVHIAAGCFLFGSGGKIVLQAFSGISSRVTIYTANDDYSGDSLTGPTVPKEYRKVACGSVTIGRHVIVGASSIILPGITLHNAAAVGALSIVKKSIPEFTIEVGAPSKKIKTRSAKLLELERKYKEFLARASTLITKS